MRILAIDVGTTNIKASLAEAKEDSLEMIESMSIRTPAETPERGAYEHSPTILFNTIKGLLERFSKCKIDSVILSSYLFGVMAMDRQLRPVTNIITWLDERPVEILGRIKAYGEELYMRTGCPPTHIYAIPKILWLKERRRDVAEKAYYYLDAKSYFIYSLTGELVTDYSSASGTQLLNIHELKWDSLALKLTELDEDHLPRLAEGDQVLKIKRIRGLEGTPLVVGLYDGGSMVYGATLGRERVNVVNLGTSAMFRTVLNKPVLDDPRFMRFQTFYLINKKWVPGGGINNGGVVIEYLVKLLNKGEFSEKVLEEAFNRMPARISEASERGLVVPLLYPERMPLLSYNWKLSILGLEPESDYIDILIIGLEGVLFLLKIIDEALYERSHVTLSEAVIGGKLSKYPAVRSLVAGVLDKRVAYYEKMDLSLIGNTFLALKALRALGSRGLEEYFKKIIIANYNIAEPRPELVAMYNERFKIFKEILKKLYYVK